MMKTIKPYEHLVQYYETDQMGVVHHSNYIRWFEEARTDMLTQIGCGYREMEEQGIISPVLSVQAEYKSMTHFYDRVDIEVKIKKYNGVKFSLLYRVIDHETGELRCQGESGHCFLNREGKPVTLKRSLPEVHELLSSMVEAE